MKTTVMMDYEAYLFLLANITVYAIPMYLCCHIHSKGTYKRSIGGTGHDIFSR